MCELFEILIHVDPASTFARRTRRRLLMRFGVQTSLRCLFSACGANLSSCTPLVCTNGGMAALIQSPKMLFRRSRKLSDLILRVTGLLRGRAHFEHTGIEALPNPIRGADGYVLNKNISVRLRASGHQVSCWYLPSFSMLSRYLSAALSSMLPSLLKTSASAARTALGIFPEDPHT